ncbi:acyl-CoA dehydrogenase family protein [Bordetella genomosp. 5]|uniref:Pimeloyl-CoA dehydrogenase small subunit n=1 Tax=Bordetella genomosp. 5 TaxID=1395608 RepID=A0A261SZA6_9BORD|nr:acyl-CoA dehydrogenase family protein [Bordetella genomosp. 5]OZI42696.1 pimeloyl-CoA dehydrogenase small subunit [Bordetella genomosp. 5]
MNFEHTEDRRMLADMLRRFVSEQYDFPARDAIARSEAGWSQAMWQRYAELGAIGALFTEADGGLGGAGFDIIVVFEALGRGLVLEPFLDTLMVGSVLARAGTSAQRERLAALIEGSATVAWAHAEPGNGYALDEVETTARRDGDHWVLDGAKAVVTLGDQVSWLLVSARVSEADIGLFLVPADAAGVARQGYPLIDGGRAAEITLSGVRVPADHAVGAPSEGAALIEHAAGRGVLALCAEALGAMDAAREATLEYLGTRRQFGAPLGSFQALQHRMADLLIEIEQARSAVINAAAALDKPERAARERALSAAKVTIGRVGTRVAEESIQLHGGIGMTWELPLAHHAKRLVMIDHQLGDEDHHLRRYIALGQEAEASA